MNKPMNKNRQRGRNNNRRGGNRGGDNSARVRNNAQQQLERYLNMARDAAAAGNRIEAENFFQHADHYQRVLNSVNPAQNKPQQEQPDQSVQGQSANGGAANDEAAAQNSAQNGSQDPVPESLQVAEQAPTVASETGEDGATEVSPERPKRATRGRPRVKAEAAEGDASGAEDAAEATGGDADEGAGEDADEGVLRTVRPRVRRTTRTKKAEPDVDETAPA